MNSEPSSADTAVGYKPPFLTFVLIGINAFVYLMIQLQGGPTYENLLRYGAKENGLIAEGEIGRLFFPMFMHANPAHILFNMFALYQFGRVFEVLTGARNLFVTYILGGLLGNAASFVLSSSLSVGASSSLFALLFALYVLERYQQKINLESTGIKTRTSLGPVIVINAVITFLIPNIDWASHLGGSIAGVLIGLGIVMKHKMNTRLLGMVKYWRVDPSTLQLRFYQREGLYLAVVGTLIFAAFFKIPTVSFADRVFGLGVLEASSNPTTGHAEAELPRYRSAFDAPESPVYPETLLQQAMANLAAGRFDAAESMFIVLKQLNKFGLGTTEFASQSTHTLLEKAEEAARSREQLDATLVQALTDENTSVAAQPGYCDRAADYARSIGFYSISGLLYRCAFFMDFGNKKFAQSAIADLWLESSRCEKNLILTFRNSNADGFGDFRVQRESCSNHLDEFRAQLIQLEGLGFLTKNGAVPEKKASFN
ncbi:MAG: rhomboid family intramembrane serine protease [Betaproteobacteria bacterium]|nr:rhomboid family intramembrane serine protease [Betaproteobacteria bacterium]